MDGWMLPPLYLCKECGYAGRLVLEVGKDDLGPAKKRGLGTPEH